MKVAFSVAFLLSSASGFAPQPFGVLHRSSTLYAARPDATSAIEAALAASKEFGPTSPEARVAWDFVEEMDASDNSVATEGSLDENCVIEEEISKACVDYGDKLDELAELVQDQGPYLEKMKSLADEMEAIKLSIPESKAGSDSPQLRAALDNARAISEEKGVTSDEAKVAWSEVEEIAASGNSNAIGTRLDEECLVDAAREACIALDELNRALNASGDRSSE